MTAASYSWPTYSLLTNGSFENFGGTSTDFSGWVEEGTPARVAAFNAGGGTYACELAQNDGVHQTSSFVVAGSGRYADQLEPLQLRFYADYTSDASSALRVQVFLLNSSNTILFSYDFPNGEWKEMPSGNDMDDGESHWVVVDSGFSDTEVRCPRIEAPSSAGANIGDTHKLRVRIINQAAATAVCSIDLVKLSPWTADTRIDRIGRFAVVSNYGRNYPVKYDAASGTVTELSLNYPYQSDNSALPTETATTGGSLESNKFFGVGYTFVDDDVNEESALPRGTMTSSGYFTVATGASDTLIQLDFSAIELPNTDDDRDTDNPWVDRIRVYRTPGFDTRAEAAAAAANELLYYEGDVAVAGTFSLSLSDQDLLDQQGVSPFPDPTRAPMPHYTVSAVHRSRLFVAGGRPHRLGEVTVSNGDDEVVGVEESAGYPNAPTRWGRWVEWMRFKVDGDDRDYQVERYIYPNDDGGSNAETLFLSEPYQGTSGGDKTYTLRAPRGRVYYSEEGRPYQASWDGYFTLDGDDGEDVVGLVSAQQALLAMTRTSTFVFHYATTPSDTLEAQPLSRDLGCIAPHSTAEIRGVAYWLSAEGVVRSDGTRVEVISNDLQDMFTDPDDPDYVARVPWSQMAADAQAVHFPAAQQYLLALKTKNGKHGCDLILVYNYFFESWDIFRLTSGLMRWSSVQDIDGNQMLGFTDDYGTFHRWWAGHVDGVGEVNNHGALVGAVSTATDLSLAPSSTATVYTSSMSNNFASATLGLEGSWVKIIAGPGTGQMRRIERVTSAGVWLFSQKWATTPTSDSLWQLGGIDFRWRGKRSNFGYPGSPKRVKFLNVDQKAQSLGGVAEVRFYQDASAEHHLAGVDEGLPEFPTGREGRVKATGKEAVGYALAVEIRCDGPQRPLEIHNLSAVVTIGQEDR